MRHRVYGRKFSRPAGHRRQMFNNLVKSLVVHGKIVTTREKARSVQGLVDRLVTSAKKDAIVGSRESLKVLRDKKLTHRLTSVIAPLFKDRPGGYTRLIPLGARFSDTARTVRMEWVAEIPAVVSVPPAKPEVKARPRPAKIQTKKNAKK